MHIQAQGNYKKFHFSHTQTLMHVYNSQLSHKYNLKYKNPIGMYKYLKSWNDQICCKKVSQHTSLSNTFLV